jgi:hypothetical protein
MGFLVVLGHVCVVLHGSVVIDCKTRELVLIDSVDVDVLLVLLTRSVCNKMIILYGYTTSFANIRVPDLILPNPFCQTHVTFCMSASCTAYIDGKTPMHVSCVLLRSLVPKDSNQWPVSMGVSDADMR